MPAAGSVDISYCGDDELGYARSRTRFVAGEGLRLDEAYRLAHLALVAPGHPDVIPSQPGAHYDRGRHPRIVSLVIPVPWGALAAAPAFQALEQELRAAPFAAKIAWDLMARRRDRLHATLCGGLTIGARSPVISAAQREALAALGSLRVELRGVFSGDVNVGRLYLRLYPERRDGENVLRLIQRILGRRETDLYLVGLYSFTDHLDAAETAALAALIERWWDRPMLRLDVDALWLLWATDDLVLDGGVAETIRLAGRG